MCLRVALFRFNLFEVLWASWIWMFISLPKFRTFSDIIPLSRHSVSFSFSSSGIPMMWILFPFQCLPNSHRFSSLFFILVYFCSSSWVTSSVVPSRSLILLHGWVYYWNSLLNFSVQLLYFSPLGVLFILVWFLMVVIYLSNFSLCLCFVFLILCSCFVLQFLKRNFLKRILLNSFSGIS